MNCYIIYLSNFETSVRRANWALETGQVHGWHCELFAGVDGRTVASDDAWRLQGPKINTGNAKCRDMMQRPGVRGCFLSHWRLWQRCIELDQPIGIFEHDIEFLAPYQPQDFDHVLKLEGFDLKKPRPAGSWYEGARAYILKPMGAKLLLDWVSRHGALPADVCIGLDVVDITLQKSACVRVAEQLDSKWDKHRHSFTWNLNQME